MSNGKNPPNFTLLIRRLIHLLSGRMADYRLAIVLKAAVLAIVPARWVPAGCQCGFVTRYAMVTSLPPLHL